MSRYSCELEYVPDWRGSCWRLVVWDVSEQPRHIADVFEVEASRYDTLRAMAKNRGAVMPTKLQATRALASLGLDKADERTATHRVRATPEGIRATSYADADEQERRWVKDHWEVP